MVYPGTHEHVVAIVAAANKHNVVIIPFGGGTSVTNAVMCPNDEKRTIVSLDMREMNKVKWVGIQATVYYRKTLNVDTLQIRITCSLASKLELQGNT